MKPRAGRTLRIVFQAAAAVIVVALVTYFFRNQFARNWQELRSAHFSASYPLLALAAGCLVISYLVSTASWQLAANALARGRKFDFGASVGMVNTTQLTKYIPGKVWSYAMQMALVDRTSLPISAVLYVNVFLVLSSSFIALVIGGLYFCLSSHLVGGIVAVPATIAVLLAYLFFLLFNGRFSAILIRFSERILRRSIAWFELSLPDMVRVQGLTLLASVLMGLSALLGSRGIGFSVDPREAIAVSVGFIFADTVGFLAFFAPGGLGVREGVFYFLLAEFGAGSLALLLPIVMRLISMLVDAILGLAGLFTLRKYVRGKVQ
jgi:uncharacterized membrane protein YbhN (UPF0104 family)